MKFQHRDLMVCGFLLLSSQGLRAQAKISNFSYPPAGNWIATCMIGGKDIKHFLLLPDGTVNSFAPGARPEPVQGLENVIAIAAGFNHMVALERNGTVWTWGRNNEFQLGNKALSQSGKDSETPVQVSDITNAIAISVMYNTSFALLADGTIWAWGNGNMGVTGDGKEITYAMTSASHSARRLPVRVKDINTAVAISGAMALLANGEVVDWGDGHKGRLGNGSSETSSSPVKVTGIKNVIAISASDETGLALLSNGEVWAWGTNYKGQLGNGATHIDQNDNSNVPVLVKGIKNAVAIDANYSCFALLKDGNVMGWGWGEIGAMGSHGRDVNSIPVKIPVIPKVIAIKAGNGFGFALLQDGSLMGWGANMAATGLYHQIYAPIKIAQVDLKKSP